MQGSLLGGALNPSEKYDRQIASFSPSRGENEKYFKPPTLASNVYLLKFFFCMLRLHGV